MEWYYLYDVVMKRDQGSLKRVYLAVGEPAKEQLQPPTQC
jgi:hypothetical protein